MRSNSIAKIGCSSDSHVRLESNSISSLHAAIQKMDQNFLLQDRESANGTYILRNRPVRIPTKKVLQVVIGNTTLDFSLPTRSHLLYSFCHNLT